MMSLRRLISGIQHNGEFAGYCSDHFPNLVKTYQAHSACNWGRWVLQAPQDCSRVEHVHWAEVVIVHTSVPIHAVAIVNSSDADAARQHHNLEYTMINIMQHAGTNLTRL